MRRPTSRRVCVVFRTVALVLATGALALASRPAADVERDCIAASIRWHQFGCAVSDLDGDHQADFAFPVQVYGSANRPASISVHLSSTQGAYELTLPAGRPALAFVLRDVNGDGYVDIALIGGLNQTVGVFLNNGSGRFEFDILDRYVTAPSTDFSQLSPPGRSASWLCATWNSGSQPAALRGRRRTDFLNNAAVHGPVHEPVDLPRFLDLPRNRAP
jgi:hypothetical protein